MVSSPTISLNDLWHPNEVFDISAPIARSPAFPGDRDYCREWMAISDEGEGYCLSSLSLSSHAATHLDFPSHVGAGRQSQSSYPPGRFIIPADVACISGEGPVDPSNLQSCRAGRGQALLIKTNNSRRGLMHEPAFSRDYVSLSVEAARFCVSRGLGLVGIDYLSVDRFDDESLPVHRVLLENDVLILEGLDLAHVPDGRYLLICLPLSIEYGEASPVRAVLVR